MLPWLESLPTRFPTAALLFTLVALPACGGSSPQAPPDDTATPPDDTATDSGTPPTDPDELWAIFLDRREAMLRDFSVPILACVAASDTSDPIFDGCYDWHSAVHGHWALYTVSRLLDDPQYAEAAERSFDADAIERELDELESGVPAEIPYGYAWFLALARERRETGADELDPLAAIVADGLQVYLEGLNDVRIQRGVLADDYDNLSWATLNLWQWANATGDSQRADFTTGFVRDQILPLDADCPLQAELVDADNFFPACLLRALTILTVLPVEEAGPWIDTFAPTEYPLTPVKQIDTAHQAGLNFSRPWGLWAIYLATGDPLWRDIFREHLDWQYARPAYWAEDYDQYSHWVPQFGVYAVAKTWEP